MNDDLCELEAAIDRALATGDASHLEVVGYGEITLVVRWTVDGRQVACKRLPGLAGDAAISAYRSCVASYIARLAERGVVVPETTVEAVTRRDGSVTAYCVQPVLEPTSLLPNRLQGAGRGEVREVLAALVERIAGCINSRLGLDAQLSNWAWTDGGLRYLDISTPFERDDRGRESFDVELHLASVPWALRGAVRRFALGAILDKYYDRRGALLDLAGNLHKERLAQLRAGTSSRPRIGWWSRRSRPARRSATTATTPGCGSSCSGCGAPTAGGSAPSAAGGTRSCCRAASRGSG